MKKEFDISTVSSLEIRYEHPEDDGVLIVDDKRIEEPIIVKFGNKNGLVKAKVFNRRNGWKPGEKLPCISVIYESQGDGAIHNKI